jgi:NADH-quinone oxidoreductase subunit N
MLGGILLLTVVSLVRGRTPQWFPAAWTVAAATFSFITLVPLWERVQDDGASTVMAGAIGLDGFSLFVTGIICISVALGALLLEGYLRREGLAGPEWYVLMLLAASGGVTMAAANDLIVMFVGLEILSVSAYVLAAMHSRRISSQEAGLKYFVLGAFSSGFLLYGIAMTYGATGSTNLVRIQAFLSEVVITQNGLLLAGMAFMIVGFGFKVGAVPFHTWVPDVYQGSPSPVSGFMASGIKAAGFAGLLRVFVVTLGPTHGADWRPMIYALAVLSLLVGSVSPSCRPTSSACWPTRRSATRASSWWRSRRPRPKARPPRCSTCWPTRSWSSAASASSRSWDVAATGCTRSRTTRDWVVAVPASRCSSRCSCWRRPACRSRAGSSPSST